MLVEESSALCQELAKFTSAVIADVLQVAGLGDQVLSWSVKMLQGESFVGPAVCMSGSSAPAPDKARSASIVFDADRAMYPGCVAVVSTDLHRVSAILGSNTVTSWHLKGCLAIVTDGLVRDLPGMQGVTVLAAGRTVLNTKGRWFYHSLMEPVYLPGQTVEWVKVEAGDIIHGDSDGTVVIPSRFAARLAVDARRTQEEEDRMIAQICGGADREDVYRSSRRYDHIQPYI